MPKGRGDTHVQNGKAQRLFGEASNGTATASQHSGVGTAFGCTRDFLSNKYVYLTVSPRARGLSVGVNMNPDQRCNFNCVYCEVDRAQRQTGHCLDVLAMAHELEQTLAAVRAGSLWKTDRYRSIPGDLLTLRHVTLSGDGEPTLCPIFSEAVASVVHLRAVSTFGFFKMVLITNATGLHLPEVKRGLDLFTQCDEIWAKLDAGTQNYMNRINKPEVTLHRVLTNILTLAKQRPVIIQSLFSSLEGEEPSAEEVQEFAQRLRELAEAGAQIPLVQIYSPTRPNFHAGCRHLPLKSLSRIAKVVHEISGLKAEVF